MIFGMLPLALKLEPGAETRAPMAVVVIGALLSSTVLTLIVVPSLYTVMDDLQDKLFKRGRKTAPAVAPAYGPVPATEHAPTPAGPSTVPMPVAAAASVPSHDGNGTASASPKQDVPLNIADRGWAYVVRAALPGVKQDDVQVVVHGHTLTIRSRDGGDGTTYGNGANGANGNAASDADHDTWIVHEHSPEHWERSLNLPHEVDESAISAEYRDGILELCLPKAEPRAERRIPVTSGSE
jgi:HSP20 family molecular chaperone IbpA